MNIRHTVVTFIFSLCILAQSLVAQQDVTTVGIAFKPIVPSNIFRAKTIDISPERENISIDFQQNFGYTFGMIIRMGLTENWTLETGLNYTKRNYSLNFGDKDTNYTEAVQFGIVGYELPVIALLNIRLDKQIYMNTAFGAVIDMYPSGIQKAGEEFYIAGLRNSWIQPALIANVGWEYRSKKNGALYIGGSYHRPFLPMFKALVVYETNNYISETFADINGTYVTIDLRYFFHEDPEKKKTLKQRKKEKQAQKAKDDVFYRPGIDKK